MISSTNITDKNRSLAGVKTCMVFYCFCKAWKILISNLISRRNIELITYSSKSCPSPANPYKLYKVKERVGVDTLFWRRYFVTYGAQTKFKIFVADFSKNAQNTRVLYNFIISSCFVWCRVMYTGFYIKLCTKLCTKVIESKIVV